MIRPLATALVVVAFAWITIASGCQREDAGDDETTPSAAITMSVTGARAVVAPIHSEVRLLGATVALRHITLRAPTAGRVLGFSLQTGDRVRRGEIVAHILNREVEAAESGVAVARRVDPNEAQTLAATVKRYVRDDGIAVAVPDNAIVAQRIVSNGQVVADLDPLAELIDPRSIYVEAAVPINDLALIKPGMISAVSWPTQIGLEFPARVAALAPNFTQGGTTASARVEFTGQDRIDQAGAAVEVRLITASFPDAIVIPDSALFEDAAQRGSYVFIRGSDGRAHRKAVAVGIRAGNRAQITAGLEPGQVVLTSGGYALSEGIRINVTVAEN
jgi:multidrug efflux pump subunit AcrA (membrane-fusion protein)